MGFLLINLILLTIVAVLAIRFYSSYRSVQEIMRLVGQTRSGYLKFNYSSGKVLDINEGMIEILEAGLRKKEIRGHDIRDFFIKQVGQRDFIEEITASEGKVERGLFHFLTLKGHERWILYSARLLRDHYTGDKVVQVLAENITEEKKSLKNMEELETRYEQLFRSSADLIIVYDMKTGKIEEVNPATEVILGYKSRQMIGKNFEEIIHPLKKGEYQDHQQELLVKKITRMEGVIVCRNGDYKDVWITMNTFEMKGRKKVIADIQDITELVNERQEQKKRRSELEKFCKAAIAREERVKKLREEVKDLKNQVEKLKNEKRDT